MRYLKMILMSVFALMTGSALPTIAADRSALSFAKQRGAYATVVQDHRVHTGNVFFVMTGGSDTAGFGLHPDRPFATVDYAIGQCTASQGDVIYVMPGYTETVTNSSRWTVDVAGIEIIGLGVSETKPTITMATDTTADIAVTAANILIRNFRFETSIDALVNYIDKDAANLILEDCEFTGTSSAQALCFINLATTVDGFTMRRCTFTQDTDPGGSDGTANTGVLYFEDVENILIEDCGFFGNFETAIFHNRSTAAKNVFVKNCHGINRLSGSETFQLVDGCSGAMIGGGFITPAETGATEATLVGTLGAGFFILAPGNFGNDGGAGGQGGIIPATAS